jgi:hypothetical protein
MSSDRHPMVAGIGIFGAFTAFGRVSENMREMRLEIGTLRQALSNRDKLDTSAVPETPENGSRRFGALSQDRLGSDHPEGSG